MLTVEKQMDVLTQPSVTLPGNLPAQCFIQSANDYNVPAMVLVALVKVESNGKSVIGKNSNGSLDLGVAQHNTNSWVPYLDKKYGIKPESLLSNPCQSIRAAAFVLRSEMNHKSCGGVNVWCGLIRYHSPSNMIEGNIYINKIYKAIQDITMKGHF